MCVGQERPRAPPPPPPPASSKLEAEGNTWVFLVGRCSLLFLLFPLLEVTAAQRRRALLLLNLLHARWKTDCNQIATANCGNKTVWVFCKQQILCASLPCHIAIGYFERVGFVELKQILTRYAAEGSSDEYRGAPRKLREDRWS